MQLADKCQVAAKQEATPGTAEVLAAANVIMTTERPTFDPDLEMIARNVLSASPSSRGMVVGSRRAKIGFKQFLRGTSGAPVDPGNLPDYVIPLRGAGMSCVVSGIAPNEVTTSTPSALGLITDTLAVMCDGKQYQIHGAVCSSMKWTLAKGSPVLVEYEFTGIYNTPTDVALFAPTYPTVTEPPFLGATFSILGFTTAKIKTLTIDFGFKVAERPQPNATGILSFAIVGREVKGTVDVEEELAAAKNWYSEWLSGTLGAIQTGDFPSTGSNYNQFNLSMPNCQYTKVGFADRDGLVTAPIEFIARANSDAGNNELSLVGT